MGFHLQTLIIYRLGFNQNHYTFTFISLVKMIVGFYIKTLIIYELSSREFTTQNDLYWLYESKRVVILIETKFHEL